MCVYSLVGMSGVKALYFEWLFFLGHQNFLISVFMNEWMIHLYYLYFLVCWSGTIPSWLNGSLYRNGPGKFSIGDSNFKHWFDGLALLHCFRIKLGRVTYCSKFVKSETFKRNMAANRIVVDEFGTRAYPDPCKNIFQRCWCERKNKHLIKLL